MKPFFILFTLLFCQVVHGQIAISGMVTDSTGHVAVARASVYISGTTKVTYTDNNGYFKLDNVVLPCQLVISHINYKLKIITLKEDVNPVFLIKLQFKEWELSSVTVKNKSLRKYSMKIFREIFLGTDNWAKKATLLNDSVLYFIRKRDTVCVNTVSSDSVKQVQLTDSNIAKQKNIKRIDETFSVTTRAPLMIDLQLLGYVLSIDIVNFTRKTEGLNTQTTLLGYFNFKPYDESDLKKQKQYERNREKIYYNSSQHFIRALYRRALLEEGYLVVRCDSTDANHKAYYSYLETESFLRPTDSNITVIEGMKDKMLNVYYFSDSRGYPLNIKENKSKIIRNQSASELVTGMENSHFRNKSIVLFLANECPIRSNGTTPDNKIVFGGVMGLKKVSVLLPDDYQPETR